MPKYSRKNQLAGSLVYHVYNRSNAKATIFKCDKDYRHFMRLLVQYMIDFNIILYHWVIMPNHYHLLLKILQPVRLSKAIGGIALGYTQYFHKRYDSCGYLWQGRFQSQPVQRERYMLACGRYIERNPVKAGMVLEAHQYEYSSAAYYCLGIDDGITYEDPFYTGLAKGRKEKRNRYIALIGEEKGQADALFEETEKPVGDEGFVRKLIRLNGRLVPHNRRAVKNSIVTR